MLSIVLRAPGSVLRVRNTRYDTQVMTVQRVDTWIPGANGLKVLGCISLSKARETHEIFHKGSFLFPNLSFMFLCRIKKKFEIMTFRFQKQKRYTFLPPVGG